MPFLLVMGVDVGGGGCLGGDRAPGGRQRHHREGKPHGQPADAFRSADTEDSATLRSTLSRIVASSDPN